MKKLLFILTALLCLTGTTLAATYANSATTNAEAGLITFITGFVAPGTGISAAQGTNIAAYQALLATNALNTVLRANTTNAINAKAILQSNGVGTNTALRDATFYGATTIANGGQIQVDTGDLVLTPASIFDHVRFPIGDMLGNGSGLTNLNGYKSLNSLSVSNGQLANGTISSNKLDATAYAAFVAGAAASNNFYGAEVLSTNGVVIRSNSWLESYTLLNGDIRLVSSNGTGFLLTKDFNSTTATIPLGQSLRIKVSTNGTSMNTSTTNLHFINGSNTVVWPATLSGPNTVDIGYTIPASAKTTNLNNWLATGEGLFYKPDGTKGATYTDAATDVVAVSGNVTATAFGIPVKTNSVLLDSLVSGLNFVAGANATVAGSKSGDDLTITIASTGSGSGGPQTNLYWDVAGTLPAVEADVSGPVMYFKAHDGAKRWRMNDADTMLNGSNSISLGVTGVDVESDIKAFFADRTGATTVGVPGGVVTIQGTVNFDSAPAFTVTANGVSTAIRSNMVQALVGSFTTTTNAGDGIFKENGVQSVISSNRVYTGTLIADTNNITRLNVTNAYYVNKSNSWLYVDSTGQVTVPTTNANVVRPDFSLPESLLSTNAAFAFLAPSNVDTTQTIPQECVIMVTNTTAPAVVNITAPENCRTTGTANVTNVSEVRFRIYPKVGTNMTVLPWF